MNIGSVTKIGVKLEKFTKDNAPTILTGIGVVGTVATAYLTGKATFKAAKIIDTADAGRENANKMAGNIDIGPLGKRQHLQLVWACYVPPAVTGATTIAAIVFANRISAKRMAALAAGYGLLEGRFDEYQDKMKEKFGIKKEGDARDEIAQEHVDKNPPPTTMIFTEGKVLFRDEPSGRYFESTMEDINRAENTLNRKIMKDEHAELTDWYDLIGLSSTSISDDYGWDITNELMELSKHAVITREQRPCIVLEYNLHPIRHTTPRGDGGGAAKMRAV